MEEIISFKKKKTHDVVIRKIKEDGTYETKTVALYGVDNISVDDLKDYIIRLIETNPVR